MSDKITYHLDVQYNGNDIDIQFVEERNEETLNIVGSDYIIRIYGECYIDAIVGIEIGKAIAMKELSDSGKPNK